MATWHPRGPQTWPDWRKAEPGITRVEHTRSGARGTFARWPAQQHKGAPLYAVVDWDTGSRGRVNAYAWDLRKLDI